MNDTIPDESFASMSIVRKATIPPARLKQIRQQKAAYNAQLLVEAELVLKDIKGKTNDGWKYFAELDGSDGLKGRYCCRICYKEGSMTTYSIKTSLSTLKAHLEAAHQIESKQPRMKSTDQLYNCKIDIKDSRDALITRTALMFIMTCNPFHMIKNQFFVDWLVTMNVIKTEKDAPSERQLSETGLERLFLFVKKEMVDQFKKAPRFLAAIFDCWTDMTQRHFFGIIFRFLNEEFEIVEFVVCFKVLNYKTSNQEMEIFNEIIQEFNLSDRNFIAVSDRGSDMLKLCRLKKMERSDCIAHAIHNLISRDVIPKIPVVNNLLKKLRAVLSAFRYRMKDLKTELKIEADREKAEFLKKVISMGEFCLLFIYS